MKWVELGDRVRRLSGPVYSVGDPAGPRLLVDAEGTVASLLPRFPEHACPDHDEAPDCACDGVSGVVPAREATAIVEWTLEDGKTTMRRAIGEEGQGTLWEHVVDEPAA